MRRRLSSHRFRRRLGWTTVAGAVVAVVVGGALKVGNTGRSFDTPHSRQDAVIVETPKLHRLTVQDRRELLATSARFVQTAVARRNLDQAWKLLGPEMRAGQTRREFLTGDNNVVPFPVVGIKSWALKYSYAGDVALDLALVAKPGEDVLGKTFTIELRRHPRHAGRWLVASWVPNGIIGPGQSVAKATAPAPPPPKSPLGAVWLAVPFSIFALVAVVPLALALRSVIQGRRAQRRYRSDYSSSSSPS